MTKLTISSIEITATKAQGLRWHTVSIHRSGNPNANWNETQHTVNIYGAMVNVTPASLARVRRAQESLMGSSNGNR